MTQKKPDLIKKSSHRIVKKILQYPTGNLSTGIALFIFFLVALALAQFATPGLVGNDGYYHIKSSYILRTEGIKPDFVWLPLTILNAQDYYDHHYLFHILMIPFTFGDLLTGAKIASVFFSALAFVSIWYLLKKQKVPYAEIWSLALLIISEAFVYRMNMPRAQSLSLLLIVWTFHVLLEKEYRQLTLIGFIYVWTYNAFPLILIVVFLYLIAYLLTERKFLWMPLVFAIGGVALGLLLNPYFPENLAFIYRHITPKLFDVAAVPVGNEWAPYKTATLLDNSGWALVVFISGVIALGQNSRRMNISTATSLFLALSFGFMLFGSRRFIEYAPPFMLIFAAFAWKPIIEVATQHHQRQRFFHHRAWLIPVISVFLLFPLIWVSLASSRKRLQENAKPYQRYEEASAWLVENTPEGSRIFQTDWDDFPQLFFYNHHNTYTIGLDPTYMQLYDSKLYEEWVEITRGNAEDIDEKIRIDFSGDYVLSDLSHTRFLLQAENDDGLKLVYQDSYAKVFQVLP
jgi:hypothetical protein